MTAPHDEQRAEPELRDLVPLSADECRTLLARRRVGRAVFVDTRGPVALPVNYVVDHHDIVFRTEGWSSLYAAPTCGPVSFEVDDLDEEERLGWSVLATGSVSHVDDPADLQHVKLLAPTPWARGPRDHYLRLTVNTITGRRLVPDDETIT